MEGKRVTLPEKERIEKKLITQNPNLQKWQKSHERRDRPQSAVKGRTQIPNSFLFNVFPDNRCIRKKRSRFSSTNSRFTKLIYRAPSSNCKIVKKPGQIMTPQVTYIFNTFSMNPNLRAEKQLSPARNRMYQQILERDIAFTESFELEISH